MAISLPRIWRSVPMGAPHQVPPFEYHPSGHDFARRPDQAENRECGDALAASRLADNANDLTATDGERHAVDSSHESILCMEMRVKILDPQQHGVVPRTLARMLCGTGRGWTQYRACPGSCSNHLHHARPLPQFFPCRTLMSDLKSHI